MARNRERRYLAIVIGLAMLLIVGCSAFVAYGTDEFVSVRVSKVERVSTGSGDDLSHKYLVFTDSETFQNTDTLWYWKWNSSDIHGRLKPGGYTLRVYGFRIPFLSMYRNVISLESD